MRIALALTTAAALSLPLAAVAVASDNPPALPATGSTGMKIVANLPGAGGTDLEFFSRALADAKTSATDSSFSGTEVPETTGKTRHFSVVGNQTKNTEIIDITDPEHPFVAARIPCTLSQGDVQVNEARSIITIANGTGTAAAACKLPDGKPMPPGAAIVDITDVYKPKVVGSAPAADGAHNLSLTPDGKHLYISTSVIEQAMTEIPIYDVTNLAAPKLVNTFTAPGNAPHDVRFSKDGKRAYTAGVSTFRILNTEDPTKPTLISTFFPPGASIGHDTLVSDDGAYLFAGDEGGGGGTYPCPGGAVHTYDIRNEALPVYLGQSYAGVGPVTNRQVDAVEPGAPGSCTSHVMDMNPDGKSFTLGWYSAGSRVFSFKGLYDAAGKPAPGPAVAYGTRGLGLVETNWIKPTGGSTWSAKQYAPVPGYIFSDDLVKGFYVTKLPAS